jgi:hypothetical protein
LVGTAFGETVAKAVGETVGTERAVALPRARTYQCSETYVRVRKKTARERNTAHGNLKDRPKGRPRDTIHDTRHDRLYTGGDTPIVKVGHALDYLCVLVNSCSPAFDSSIFSSFSKLTT